MTTFKYSVPWFENEMAMARVCKFSEWTEACEVMGSRLPEVHLPATAHTEELDLEGGVYSHSRKSSWREVYSGFLDIRGRATGAQKKALRGVVARVKMEKRVMTGLKGVHAAFLHLKEWAANDPTSYADKVARWASEVAAITLFGHVYHNRLSTYNSVRKCRNSVERLATDCRAPVQVLEAIRKMKSGRHAAVFRKSTVAMGKEEDPERKLALVRKNRAKVRGVMPPRFPRMEVWGSRVVMRTAYGVVLLSTGDLQRLEQYAANWVNVTAAMTIDAVYRSFEKRSVDAAEWMAGEMVAMSEACLAVPKEEEVHVCRAYMQAYTAALASHAGIKAAETAAVEELHAMPYAEESGAVRHFKELAGMPVREIVGVGKVHKTLPASCDMGAATAYARYLKAREENPRVEVEEGRPPVDDDLFRKCLRDEVTRALRLKDRAKGITLKAGVAKPKWFTAWEEKMAIPRFAGWSDVIDLRGEATAPARSDFSPGTFKDSALAPDAVPTDATDVSEKEHTSMILRRFLDPAYPSVAEAKKALQVAYPRTTKADQKPENYKHPLRLFYMATLTDRIGVSYTEAAVYSVAKYHPCYMLGASPQVTQERARSMIEPSYGGKAKRFFSFDLSNWSAGMAEKVQRLSGEIWAEVFDDKFFGSAYNTMAMSTVYVHKHGSVAGYVSPTANFEGYDGKAMTMVHLALMSAAVQRTRDVTGRADIDAQLMTYIDDGAAAIETRREIIDEVFREFMKCAEEVYGYERFVLHATKCMPSDRMFTFLNEVYYAGSHMVSATKAAMRIASEPKEEHESLVDRVMVLSSGTQGAVTAGLDMVVAAVFCYFLIALELLTWVKRARTMLANSPTMVGVMIASPAAYCGLAVPGPVGFGKTAKGASLAEGISAMQSFAKMIPVLRPILAARLRKPLPTRSYTAIMRNPTGHGGHSMLRTNLVATAVKDALHGRLVNDVARKVMDPAFTFPTEDFGRALLEGNHTVSAAAIQMAWKSTPMPLAEAWVAKFENSRTIAHLVGRAKLRAIGRAHRADAAKTFSYNLERFIS